MVFNKVRRVGQSRVRVFVYSVYYFCFRFFLQFKRMLNRELIYLFEISRFGNQVFEYIFRIFLGELWRVIVWVILQRQEEGRERKIFILDFSLRRIELDRDIFSFMGWGQIRGRNRRNFQEEGDIKVRVLKYEQKFVKDEMEGVRQLGFQFGRRKRYLVVWGKIVRFRCLGVMFSRRGY